jgi:NAD(P)-dependent dehydrogenase (short-subunit alcohol dehydrogenase family)
MTTNAAGRRVALITGAGGGIGRATAHSLADEGYALILCDVTRAAATTTAAALAGTHPDNPVLVLECDVSSPESVEAARDRVAEWTDRIDVLALIAGMVQDAASVTELTLEHWDDVLGVNLRGVFLCTHYLAPLMPKNAGASIVTIASWWGRSGHAFFAAYCASKAGVISLTQSLAAELAEHGIRVNAVAPGNIDTGMHRSALEVEARARGLEFEEMKAIEWAKIPLGYAGPPSSIADAVSFLASERASYVTGTTLDVNGGVLFS